MRGLAISLALLALLALAVIARGAECSDSTVLIADEGPTPTPSPSPTPTPTPSPTPTPTPTPPGNWATLIDHCWPMEGNANDACTGATAVDLVNVGSPTYSTSTFIAGAQSVQFTSTQALQAPATTDLASPASDNLTVWCWVNLSSVASNSTLVGKWQTGAGYDLYLLVNTGAEDLGGSENAVTPAIANIWSATPTGWSFIAWRGRSASGATTMRLNRWTGSSTLNVATAATSATLSDASATKFGIGTGGHGSTAAGNFDDCGWEAAVLADTALCKICSCGVDNSACTCSGTTFTGTGRRTTDCGSCTLPADCTADPATIAP